MKRQHPPLMGLTDSEVQAQIAAGRHNHFEENVAKSTTDILKDNCLTLFNFLNLFIALCLAAVGAFSNLFFMAIICVNVVIGIFQEIHARNLVSKLTLVSKERVTVIRNGEELIIDAPDLVEGDLVKIGAGEQIQADMRVVQGQVEANESLLTGESDLIEKAPDAILLSGSFLSSGQCYAEVIHVGADNYANKIAQEAKVHKVVPSELLDAIRKVSKFTSFIIVPIGVILFLEAFFLRQDAIKTSVVSSAAALLGMLPKGLALLISIALATAVTKLAKKRILVQNMYSVETLAHVDMICLDKTGTITEGKMKVQELHYLEAEQAETNRRLANYLDVSEDNNITMQAIRQAIPAEAGQKALTVVAFSSERKWSAMTFEDGTTAYLGAPERLLPSDKLPEAVTRAQTEGFRTLLFGWSKAPLDPTAPHVHTDFVAGVLFEIDDPIRQDADKTLAYLKAEGIGVKVISGDNPITVSNIARRAGLENYQEYIDCSKITDDEALRDVVNRYSVFGRVSPQQKRTIIQTLKGQGHTVAMTGDGVNDVLALREADCSIAMAEGDGATRQIANLVLLDSDFTTLPSVLFEGRRVVNNVTKVASVFFIKTIYSLILSLLCIVSTVVFPFIPIQITLLDLAIEGYPAFFLSFEEDKRKIKGAFLRNVLGRALPNALLVVMNIVAVYGHGQYHGWTQLETTTTMYYLLIGVSLLGVLRSCLPFNPLRVFLFVTTAIGTYTAAWLFHSILHLGTLSLENVGLFVVLMIITVVIRMIVDRFMFPKVKKA